MLFPRQEVARVDLGLEKCSGGLLPTALTHLDHLLRHWNLCVGMPKRGKKLKGNLKMRKKNIIPSLSMQKMKRINKNNLKGKRYKE